MDFASTTFLEERRLLPQASPTHSGDRFINLIQILEQALPVQYKPLDVEHNDRKTYDGSQPSSRSNNCNNGTSEFFFGSAAVQDVVHPLSWCTYYRHCTVYHANRWKQRAHALPFVHVSYRRLSPFWGSVAHQIEPKSPVSDREPCRSLTRS